jgi:hypothetical protein
VSEKVTHQNYPSFATRTERIPTEETPIKDHLVAPLFGAFEYLLRMGEVADELKRGIYYGQPKSGVEIMGKLPQGISWEAPSKLSLTPVQYRMLHAAIGMVTEAVEFMEVVVNNLKDGKEFDPVHVMEEVGDQSWYQAIPINIFGLTVEQVLATNIAKLQRRYPEKFDLGKAVNRDTAAERVILEQGYAGK